MKTNDCDLLSDCENTSNMKNSYAKRSFVKSSESNISDDNISYKKKKIDNNSQENINNAVLTTPNGYMTRNRLKKQLIEKNELQNCITKDEYSTRNKPLNKSGAGKRIRNSMKTVQNNKLKLGYVFTHDIFPERQLGTSSKKNIPLLFESDSESDIEIYHLNNSVKNEVKEESVCTSELECAPAFDKNIGVKTYFNKKILSVNNISNNIPSNAFEEINETKKSLSFSYKVENHIGSNECEKVSQNEKNCYEPMDISGPTMSIEDSINDEKIIVTDAFVRELEREIQMENTFLPDTSNKQELSNDSHNIKSNVSNIGHHSKNEITLLKFEKIPLDFQDLDESKNQDICNDSNFKSNFSNMKLHLDTEMISNKSKVLSLGYNNLKLNSKCQCKQFFSFNKDANKLLTSKIKHFVFDNKAKLVRQKSLHQKHLEANNLKMLIIEEKKYTAQPKMCSPSINTIPINIECKKCVNVKENHIDEPSILDVLKDVCANKDYMSEFNNKSPELQKSNKINVQASLKKPTDNKNKNNSSIFTSNSKLPDGNLIHFGQNIITDNNYVSTNSKRLDENCVYFHQNKITNNEKVHENLLNFNEKKTTVKMVSSNYATNEKLHNEYHTNFDKNKIADDIMSNIEARNENHDSNSFIFGENKITNYIDSSNSTTNEKFCNEKQFNFVCNDSYNKITTPPITQSKKLVFENNVKNVDDEKIGHEAFVSKSRTYNTIHNKNHDFGENKITNYIDSSNTTTNEKLCNENPFNFVRHKSYDEITAPPITQSKTLVFENNVKNIDDEKIGHEAFVSKSRTYNTIHNKNHDFGENKITNYIDSSNITTNEKLCNENPFNFVRHKSYDEITTPPITQSKTLVFENNVKNVDDEKIGHEAFVSKSRTYNTIHNKNHDFDENKIANIIVTSSISTNKKPTDDVFSYIETNNMLPNESDVNFCGKNTFNDNDNIISNISKKIKPEDVLPDNKNFIDFDCAISCSIFEENNFGFDGDCKSSKMNFIYDNDSNRKIKIEEFSIYNDNGFTEMETINHNTEMEIKPSESYNIIAPFLTENNTSDENHLTQYVSIQTNKSLFDISYNDVENSISNYSSDDENKLQIDYEDNFENNKNSTSVHSLDNKSKYSTVADNLHSDKNIDDCIPNIEFSKNNLVYTTNIQAIESSTTNNGIAFKPIILKKELDSLNINENENSSISKIKNHLNDCVTKEACNDLYKNKLIKNDDNSNKNIFFSEKIQDIFKEMYVDNPFVTVCQHIMDLYDDDCLKNDPIYFQTNGEHINSINEKKDYDIEAQIDMKRINPELNHLIQSNPEALFKFNTNNNKQENNKPSDLNNKTKNVNAKQKLNSSKSNMKIRLHLRDFIKSNKSIDEILETKEFRNLRFFKEEEIACSIGVFIFEQTIEPPTITGLSSYKVNCDELSNEEKNKLLGSTNLSIICPKIMKLTSITLALVKMFRSDSLIDLILNVIRKNVLNKQMNINHVIDNQLITQTVYYVDICIRLRLLKNLQTFIFDSMVFIPNKYCCVIFVSLLLWKNCLPRCMNNEQDPVIINVISYLIAKKKFYSEQIAGCDIFQRELINLLSFHFNYKFSTDLPVNFIQHIHKPDFFVSVVMLIKCCNPKDLMEFMVNCLFPIIEDYLRTQQNERYALKMIESIIIAIKPFKITCNTTIATYLKKYKVSINNSKKDDKEHVYNIMFNNYRALQDKIIEYLNDYKSCSQSFEESLVSLIMVLGSVDYLSSCISLMKWKPRFEPSTILLKKIDMFKSILGHNLWNKLSLIVDTDTMKCLVNSCLLKKDVYSTIMRLHALC